jgi:prophage regulatory protein
VSERFIPPKVVCQRISLSKAELYRRIRKGEFPKPVPIGNVRVAFRESEVDERMQRCIARAPEAMTERRRRVIDNLSKRRPDWAVRAAATRKEHAKQ